MAEVKFYHLTRSSVEETALLLLGRAVPMGLRVMLRGRDLVRLAALDDRLWMGPDESFIPHGLEGAGFEADQPVLLGQGPIANAATALMLVDGAETDAAEVAPLERVWILFDGLDEAALARAREQWKALAAQGVAAEYWSEAGGRWEKRAG